MVTPTSISVKGLATARTTATTTSMSSFLHTLATAQINATICKTVISLVEIVARISCRVFSSVSCSNYTFMNVGAYLIGAR